MIVSIIILVGLIVYLAKEDEQTEWFYKKQRSQTYTRNGGYYQ